MKVNAIIPAFNEEKTIGDIIGTLKEVDYISGITVVSDGSRDGTAEVAKSMGADVIDLDENIGKGGAIKIGIEKSTGDIILLLDADLIGLKREHIVNLIEPVMMNEADMTLGIFARGRLSTDLAQKISPYLSGQRALKGDLADDILKLDISRYGAEIVMTRYAIRENKRIKIVSLYNATHYTKEEKLGLAKGFAARMKMYWDIVKCLKN
ncbi:MAG TPA: glycosyl transferase family 2 [Clostridiaceae bacterium]|nr:glycosyl transferase family 2 [Clostridiaceae bacterium]